jgi:hypothetical protein
MQIFRIEILKILNMHELVYLSTSGQKVILFLHYEVAEFIKTNGLPIKSLEATGDASRFAMFDI